MLPLWITTFPPLAPSAPVEPAPRLTAPPAVVLDVPTSTDMSPPSPPAAVPVPIDIDPDAPDDDTPELNTKAPLTPFALLESGVRIYIWPDVLAVPVPLNIDIIPPTLLSPVPLVILIAPPTVPPRPADTENKPPA